MWKLTPDFRDSRAHQQRVDGQLDVQPEEDHCVRQFWEADEQDENIGDQVNEEPMKGHNITASFIV